MAAKLAKLAKLAFLLVVWMPTVLSQCQPEPLFSSPILESLVAGETIVTTTNNRGYTGKVFKEHCLTTFSHCIIIT